MSGRTETNRAFERRIGRLLIAVTYLAVTFLVIGVALMALDGISPLAGGPALDPGALVADLVALDPAGFLWLGLLTVIATPISRVIAAAIGFARVGDRMMVGVAVAILAVIALGIVLALAGSA